MAAPLPLPLLALRFCSSGPTLHHRPRPFNLAWPTSALPRPNWLATCAHGRLVVCLSRAGREPSDWMDQVLDGAASVMMTLPLLHRRKRARTAAPIAAKDGAAATVVAATGGLSDDSSESDLDSVDEAGSGGLSRHPRAELRHHRQARLVLPLGWRWTGAERQPRDEPPSVCEGCTRHVVSEALFQCAHCSKNNCESCSMQSSVPAGAAAPVGQQCSVHSSELVLRGGTLDLCPACVPEYIHVARPIFSPRRGGSGARGQSGGGFGARQVFAKCFHGIDLQCSCC